MECVVCTVCRLGRRRVGFSEALGALGELEGLEFGQRCDGTR